MTILVCRQAQIREHWQQTVAAFRNVLPETGGHYTAQTDADEFNVQLAIGNLPSETTLRYDGRMIRLIPFLDTPSGQPSSYWLAWHESWRIPQTTGRDRRQFRSSSIAIYVGLPGSNKVQVLRAEWAGAEIIARNKEVFQGQGAAHPHWHLAGLETKNGTTSDELSISGAYESSQSGLAAFSDTGNDVSPVRDRSSLLDPSAISRLDAIEPAWASIHLAASARWAQVEWNGPSGPHDTHAINPADCGEIRSWIVSCVKYLQYELQNQVRRGRY